MIIYTIKLLITSRPIFESLGMFHDCNENCNSSNIMAPELVDYTNVDRQKSFFFSEDSIELMTYQIAHVDG